MSVALPSAQTSFLPTVCLYCGGGDGGVRARARVARGRAGGISSAGGAGARARGRHRQRAHLCQAVLQRTNAHAQATSGTETGCGEGLESDKLTDVRELHITDTQLRDRYAPVNNSCKVQLLLEGTIEASKRN